MADCDTPSRVQACDYHYFQGSWRDRALRAAAVNPCARQIEGVQCAGNEKGARGCGAVWLRQPHQKCVRDWGWCPSCGNWSTWDVDLEFLLIGEEACSG